MKLVIDAGHGGKDPGAVGINGVQEKQVNLIIAHRVFNLVNNYMPVIYTRADDVDVSLEDRVKIAEDFGAGFFLSLHCDAFNDARAAGITAYCLDLNPATKGYQAAALMLARIVNVCSFEGYKYVVRGVKNENYYVLRKTTMPAVLLEMGFITNPGDKQWLVSPKGQLAISYAIAQAILEISSNIIKN